MKLLGTIESKVTKNKSNEYMSCLKITEVSLTHCNVVNNSNQQNVRVLCIIVPYQSFGQLLSISPQIFVFLKSFDLQFSHVAVWITDQNSKPLEIEDKINIILVIN